MTTADTASLLVPKAFYPSQPMQTTTYTTILMQVTETYVQTTLYGIQYVALMLNIMNILRKFKQRYKLKEHHDYILFKNCLFEIKNECLK